MPPPRVAPFFPALLAAARRAAWAVEPAFFAPVRVGGFFGVLRALPVAFLTLEVFLAIFEVFFLEILLRVTFFAVLLRRLAAGAAFRRAVASLLLRDVFFAFFRPAAVLFFRLADARAVAERRLLEALARLPDAAGLRRRPAVRELFRRPAV